jgi:sortase A
MLTERISRRAKRPFIAVGFFLLVVAWAQASPQAAGRKALLRRGVHSAAAPLACPTAIDDRLWSPKRNQAYQESLRRRYPAPLAVRRIPCAAIEAPVLAGTDEATLNRAVGWIEGTAGPRDSGNFGIAGHRDGFFRGLKDVVGGDAITLVTVEGTQEYVVDDVVIVSPEDISVLDATSDPTLTLVTCYPFYFVGNAPQRYIVRAVRRGGGAEKASSPR